MFQTTNRKGNVIFLIPPQPELKVLLKARAKKNGRSLNAECCIILQRAVNDTGFRL